MLSKRKTYEELKKLLLMMTKVARQLIRKSWDFCFGKELQNHLKGRILPNLRFYIDLCYTLIAKKVEFY